MLFMKALKHLYLGCTEGHECVCMAFRYHRMDGSTNVAVRSRLVDDFNSNEGVFLFLLTTKVGGLGINLTGADRCASSSCTADARTSPYRSAQSNWFKHSCV